MGPLRSGSLFELLENEHILSPDLEDHRQARYLDRYLANIRARTVVVEPDYNDVDYLDDFASYYVRCFPEYGRHCRRLHFFSSEFDGDRFRRIIGNGDGVGEKLLKASYLGFIVARPLPGTVLGRTVLATYEENERRRYPVTRRYQVHLFGLELEIESLPYQQQDNAVSACATVALWSAFGKTAELFGTPAHRPARITADANQFYLAKRSMPSVGLSTQQICQAIRAVGLEAEVYPVRRSTPLLSLIYAHLAMGLPVILGAKVEQRDLHTVLVNGYSVVDHVVPNGETVVPAAGVPMLGQRIDELFVHDDQVGPFAWIRVNGSGVDSMTHERYSLTFKSSWPLPRSGDESVLYPTVVIVPAYPKIRIDFITIYRRLVPFHELLRALMAGTSTLEWDLRLQTTNGYKEELRQKSSLLPAEEELLFESQPRFLWRATLHVDGVPRADFMADATDLPTGKPVRTIVWYDAAFKEDVQRLLSTDLNRAALETRLGRAFVERLLA